MTSISFGIIVFAYFVPIYVVPVVLDVSNASNCTDYNCANSTFTKCGGYSSSESNGDDSIEFWKKGMHGMLCIMGIGKSASIDAYLINPRTIIAIPTI